MNPRRLALLPLAALLAMAVPADAAPAKRKPKPKPKPPPPVCLNITDAAGDTFATRAQDVQKVYGPQEDGLDIVSADLASDGKIVTAVVRFKALTRSIPLSPTGITTGIDFLIGADNTQVVRLQAVLAKNQPDRFEVASRELKATPNTPMTFVGQVTGVVDEANKEVRIHAPAELLAPLGMIKPGVLLVPGEAESATAARAVPAITTTPGQPMSSRGPFADVAIAGKSIAVGAASCVIPGK